jgi:uncharacterized protein YjbI with pentapeptide repeats
MDVSYIFDKEIKNRVFERDEMNFQEFESCTFDNCDFSLCNFIAVTFIDCRFNNCNFDGTKINHVAFRTVAFNNCKIREVNFSMCDKLIFEIHFNDCVLDFSKFYTLKLKETTFIDCSLVAVDFMSADLTEAIFENCDLYRSEFEKATIVKANLLTSYNYTIDPTKTKIKKAMFSLEGVKGLLYKHDIIIVNG